MSRLEERVWSHAELSEWVQRAVEHEDELTNGGECAEGCPCEEYVTAIRSATAYHDERTLAYLRGPYRDAMRHQMEG